MAATYKSRFLRIMATQERELKRMFEDATERIQAQMLRVTNEDGVIPRSATRELQESAGRIIESKFIGTVPQSGERGPFYLRNGEIIPLSPFSFILMTNIEKVTRLAVEEHASIMRRFYGDDFTMRVNAVASSLVAQYSSVSEAGNPFAGYDPSHKWVDPNGYRLSDRIWNTSNATRGRIDAMLADGIRSGKSSRAMAKDLEKFLIPGREGLTTRKPYGSKASFDAMRLARTETTRAHASASEVSALANPFVTGMNVILSRSHPKRDICDTAASASPFPKDAIPDQYRIPLHPHCLCHYTYELVENPADVMKEELAALAAGRKSFEETAGPMAVDAFVKRLLTGGISAPGPFDSARLLSLTPIGAAPAGIIPTPAIVIVPAAPTPTVVTAPTVVEPVTKAPTKKPRKKRAPKKKAPVIETQEFTLSEESLESIRKRVTDGDFYDVRAMSNETEEELAERLSAVMKTLHEDRPVSIRMSNDTLDKVLDSGRIKSQFETGKSGGTMDHKLRAVAERRGIGYPARVSAKKRPIYGYIEVLDRYDGTPGAGFYGDLQVVLKPEVRKRSTYTIGDSLGQFGRGHQGATSFVDDGIEAMDNFAEALDDLSQSDDVLEFVNKVRYVEVQVQGGVSLDDIDYVLDGRRALTKQQIEQLEAKGIRYRTKRAMDKIGARRTKDVVSTAEKYRYTTLDEYDDEIFDLMMAGEPDEDAIAVLMAEMSEALSEGAIS